MTRFERIQNLSIEEMAEKIIKINFTDEYCRSDCGEDNCPLEKECCVKWLNEEVEE